MASEGNSMSDERIGTALIKQTIDEELKNVPSEDVPPFTSQDMQVKTEEEQKMVTQLGKLVRIVGGRVKDDKEFQDAIDGVARGPGSMWKKFKKVVDKVFEHGITWERIAVLIYVAGKLAIKMVEARIPQTVWNILKWTVEFFRKNLLGWIRDHGGWINSFSELAVASVQRVSFSCQSYGFIVIFFFSGMALGSFITWRLTRQL